MVVGLPHPLSPHAHTTSPFADLAGLRFGSAIADRSSIVPKKSTRTATKAPQRAAKLAPSAIAPAIAPIAPAPPPPTTHVLANQRVPVTPGMLLTLRTLMDVQLSPDGAYIAFTLIERASDRPKS